MAIGTGLGGIVSAVLPLVGLFTIWKARRDRKSGVETPMDAEIARRKAERQEVERRMASYLSQRGSGGHSATYDDSNEQEIRR
jgi:hypothetical protein